MKFKQYEHLVSNEKTIEVNLTKDEQKAVLYLYDNVRFPDELYELDSLVAKLKDQIWA